MFADSQVFRYALTLVAIVAGAFRLEDFFGPAFGHAVRSYSLDLCSITHQVIRF